MLLLQRAHCSKQPLAKNFGSFANLEILVNVLINRPTKLRRRDMVTDDIVHVSYTTVLVSPLAERAVSRYSCSTASSTSSGTVANAFAFSDLNSSATTSCCTAANQSSLSPEAVPACTYFSATPWELQLVSSFLVVFRTNSQAFVEEVYILPFAGIPLRVDSSCSVNVGQSSHGSKCRYVSSRSKRIDRRFSFRTIVFTTRKEEM